MSHHDSTPASVLNAPVLRPRVIHAAPGLNRAERRHFGTTSMERWLATLRQTNTPFVGTTSDLYPKVR